MPPRFSTVVLGLTLLLGAVSAAPTVAQPSPVDSVRAAALRDFHGPDLEGKDGALAKAGLDLLVLYHEYQAFRRHGGDAFRPSASGVRVRNGRVTVDAIASSTAERLRAVLEDIGLTDAATAGRIVSGHLPIDSIPALARVEALRGVAPSRMRTRSAPEAPSPAPPASPSPPDTASSAPTSRAPSAPSEPPSAADPPPKPGPAPPPDSANVAAEAPGPQAEGLGTTGILALLASAAALLVLFLVFRR